MTGTQIGDVPIAIVENFDITSQQAKEEIDLVGEDQMLVLVGEDGGNDLSLDFALTEQQSNKSIEEQRDNVKSLASNDASQNPIKYDDKRGHISVESVSVPQGADEQTINRGTIDGKFLEWPKHFTDSPPEITWDIESAFAISFDSSGNMVSYSKIDTDTITLSLVMDDVGIVKGKENSSSFEQSSDIEGSINNIYSYSSDIYMNMTFGDEPSGFGTTFGRVFGSSAVKMSRKSNFNSNISISNSVEGSINLTIDGDFGRNFGASFGGAE